MREGVKRADQGRSGVSFADRILRGIGGGNFPIMDDGGRVGFGVGVNATIRRRLFLSCGHCKGFASSPYPP